LDWDINRDSHNTGRSDWDIDISLSKKTLPDRIGTSTHALANFARSDWDVNTSHHSPQHGLYFFFKKRKERKSLFWNPQHAFFF